MTGVLRARVSGAWVDVVSAGSEEVHVGPSPPVGTEEMWYDTDEAGAGFGLVANPNNALGIVAMGVVVAAVPTNVTNTGFQVTNNITFTPLVGRRYRIVISLRALVTGAAGYLQVFFRNGTTNLNADAVLPYIPVAEPLYNSLYFDWIVDGDGVAKSYNVNLVAQVGKTISVYGGSSFFYLEDVGPISTPALPVPALMPWASAETSAGTSVPSNAATVTALGPWTLPLNNLSATTTGTRVTVMIAGWYFITIQAGFGSNAAGTRLVALHRNNAVVANFSAGGGFSNTSGYGLGLNASGIIQLAASDYLEVVARQDSGAALATNGRLSLNRVA